MGPLVVCGSADPCRRRPAGRAIKVRVRLTAFQFDQFSPCGSGVTGRWAVLSGSVLGDVVNMAEGAGRGQGRCGGQRDQRRHRNSSDSGQSQRAFSRQEPDIQPKKWTFANMKGAGDLRQEGLACVQWLMAPIKGVPRQIPVFRSAIFGSS